MKKGAIQIGRNEPCPCGSGKRYMDCCLSTKYLVNYNYKNQAVMLDKNDTFNNFKSIMSINKWLNKLRSPSTEKVEFTIEDGFKTLAKTYSLLNNALEEISHFTSCKRGCSACCHRKIEISYIEAEHIKRYIKNEFSEDESRDFKKRLESGEDNRCIFLSDRGECTVYKARPVECRTHVVFSHPKSCSPESEEKPLEYSDATLSITENTVSKISKIYDTDDEKYKKKFIRDWF